MAERTEFFQFIRVTKKIIFDVARNNTVHIITCHLQPYYDQHVRLTIIIPVYCRRKRETRDKLTDLMTFMTGNLLINPCIMNVISVFVRMNRVYKCYKHLTTPFFNRSFSKYNKVFSFIRIGSHGH